jgi:parallel beta-helix repeat protein
MINRRNFLAFLGLGWFVSTLSKTNTLLASNPSLKPVSFYVAPDGNDRASGKRPRFNDEKTDGPFATIARSRDAIRQLKREQGGTLKQPVTVFLRGGTYFLTEPITFSAEDSGTKECPVTYQAYRNEKPILSGGRLIKEWRQVSLNGKKLWVAYIPEVHQGKWFFQQMWVNQQRRDRARYPKKGYLKVAGVPDITPQTQWNQGQNRLKYRPGELQNWHTSDRAEVVVMTRWLESRSTVTSIDEREQILTFDKPSFLRIAEGDLYYLENALEILEDPGEWYLDRKLGRLYYMPMTDEEENEVNAIVPVLTRLIELQEDWRSEKFVEHLTFENLTFAHTQWYYPEESHRNSSVQAACDIPGAIYGSGVRFCTWKDCTIAHISNYGIELASVCQDNQVINCQLFDLGAGGIKIYANGGNKIVDCHIYDGGRIFHGAVGIFSEISSGNYIARNHIHDFYYSGISVGWTWGYAQSWTQDNIIEFNHIHHIGLLTNGDGPLLNDKGGIYTLGIQKNTLIRSNTIHDIQAFDYGAWGIYLDEGSSQILIENNVVYQTRDGGFHIHYGKDNIIRNNIFAFGQLARSLNENHFSFSFDRNIVCWEEGKLLEGNWDNLNFAFDRNLYWQIGGGKIVFDNFSWNQWQERGMDKNSLIADPLFVEPHTGNFALQPNSPAFKLGFQPLA